MAIAKDCKKGDDTTCKSSYGQDACCMMVQCVDAPDSPNSIQSIQQAGWVAIGYPVKKGDSTHICNLSTELLRASQDTQWQTYHLKALDKKPKNIWLVGNDPCM